MGDIPLRCRGARADGRACRNLLGWLVDGRLVVKVGGRKIEGVELTPALVIHCEDCHEPSRPLFLSRAATSA